MLSVSPMTGVQLQQARRDAARRFMACALANTPESVRLIRVRKSLTGMAFLRTGEMCAPRPTTRKSLYIFLHECAHFALHSAKRKPRHVEEMEAEQWAHARMREASIPVPRAMTKSAKQYVSRKIGQALARGAKRISPAARRFAS